MIHVKQGENRLLERPLVRPDGTSISVSGLSYAKVDLVQFGTVKKSLVLGTDPELTANATDDGLKLELTTTIVALCHEGQLSEIYTLKQTSSAFPDDSTKAITKIEVSELYIHR